MSLIPGVTVNPQDFGIGATPGTGEGVQVKIGTATVLGAGEIVAVVTAQAAKDRVGGKLGEAAAVALAEGAAAVICMAVTPTNPGTAGAVTKTGTGTGTLALTGSAPLDDYQLRVEVTRAGANLAAATAAIKISLNGGLTYGPEVAIPVGGVYAIPNTGLTLTFANGGGNAFVAGDYWTASTTAPSFTTGDLTTALTALFARTELRYRHIHIVGVASAAAVAAVNTLLEARATDPNNPRFVHAILDGADDTDANLIAAFAASTSVRVGVGAGMADVFSPIQGRLQRRPAAWPVSGRYSAKPIQEHPGRYDSGPLKTVAKLHRDEAITPALDAARFSTLRTIQGGFYVTRGRLLAPPGSDYEQVQYREVMDVACEEAWSAWLKFLNETIRVSANTGRILEKEALRIEAYVQGRVRTVLRGRIGVDELNDGPAAYVVIDRAENLLSTRTIPYDISIVPVSYAEKITGRVRFFNPNLQPVVAPATT